MSEMAAEDPRPLLCAVCSTPLPAEPPRRGRPWKVCRDEDSPTPGGCANFRDNTLRRKRQGGRGRPVLTGSDRRLLDGFTDAGHGFHIE